MSIVNREERKVRNEKFMTENDISHIVLSSAIKVHKALGPGLLESAYQACLACELKKLGLLINFNETFFKKGFKRVVNKL
ncbi:MAG: GxxExxY protein [Balneolales bacterium]|nr:GxxExxY protein [Balneolales bacterium]